MQLAGRTAIVTGAGSGFGAAIARRFALEGAKVALLDINRSGIDALAREIGQSALPIECDVGSAASVKAAIAAVSEAFGSPAILVNNAGITHKNQPLLEVDEETFDRVIRVNIKSIYLMVQAVVPLMSSQGGVILNMGSTAGFRPRPGLTWYNMTKGAVNAVSKSLAAELAPLRIRVNAICPAMSETGLLEEFMGKSDTPENREHFISSIPLGRLCTPEDVARSALFLASDEAEFLTGVLLPVDGGRTI